MSNNAEEKIFNKSNSKALYGVAAIAMIYHHMFLSESVLDWDCDISLFNLFGTFGYGGISSVAWLCKLCVATYAFISGFAVYINLGKEYDSSKTLLRNLAKMYKVVAKYLLRFLVKFWIVFLAFIPLGYIIGDSQETNVHGGRILSNFIGIFFDYNGSWWYVRQYYLMMLVAPMVLYFLFKFERKWLVFLGLVMILVLLCLAYYGVAFGFLSSVAGSNTIVYLLIFIEGILCSKYGVFDKVKLNKAIVAVLLIGIFLLRIAVAESAAYNLIDLFIIVPVLFCLCVLINSTNYIKRFFCFVGQYSTYIWLSHGFFFAYYMKVLLVHSSLTFVVWLEVLILSLLVSVFFKLIEALLAKRISFMRT